MKKATAVFVLLFALLGLSGFAGAGGGCCALFASTTTTSSAATRNVKASSSASEKVATLHIKGMTCGSCATAVKRVLTRVDGVKAATVSYEKNSAIVTYEPAKVTPEKIARAVEEKLPTYKARVIK